MIWALGVIAAVYVVYAVVMAVGQEYAIFPGRLMSLPKVPAPSGVERWTLAMDPSEPSGDELFAWWTPAAGLAGGDRTARPVVIFAHGNGEYAEHNFEVAAIYARLGVHVLMPEYRGYAGMDGSPSERTLSNDFVRWHDQVISRDDVDASRVLLHGRSIGGGVVGALARRREPTAMVLESTFTSLARMAWRFGLPEWLLRSPMRTREVVAGFDGPILFMHGTADTLIPLAHAERNLAVAQDGRLVTRRAGHNDLMVDQAWYAGAIEGFVAELGWQVDEGHPLGGTSEGGSR